MFNKVFRALITVVMLFAVNANAAPLGYSVNSDGQEPTTWDGLYLIDLATGIGTRQGTLWSSTHQYLEDTEGLAFDTEGTLWGVDEFNMILFPIPNPAKPTITSGFIDLKTMPTGGGNDFGMTFTCEGALYLTSVVNQTLHRVNMTGTSQVIGNMGANISAIAAIGNPTRLYGLGNGRLENGAEDSPYLFSIDTSTGVATRFASPLGGAVLPYNEAGLSFDAQGKLWAITDRSKFGEPSQILQIDTDTGQATAVSTTAETGFESLAITPPGNCNAKADVTEDYPKIPTLNFFGMLGTAIGLLLAGLVFLRRRTS